MAATTTTSARRATNGCPVRFLVDSGKDVPLLKTPCAAHLTTDHIPDSDGPVGTTRGDALAVRAKRNGPVETPLYLEPYRLDMTEKG